MSEILYLLLALFFVLLNTFFVAAEFSMVKLRHTRVQAIRKTYGMRGKILFLIHSRLDIYLSACQLGITLASLALGWIGEPAFVDLLEPLFYRLDIASAELIEVIAFAVAFSIISFLHIVVGELMPKSLAIRQSEKVSLWTAIPLYGFYWLMYPAIAFLNWTANVLLRLFKLDAVHKGELNYSKEEIKFILRSAHRKDTAHQYHQNMLIQMLDFPDLIAVDVMQSVTDMISINDDDTLENKLAIMKKHNYSRYPVYKTNNANVLGVLHTKDVFIETLEKRLDSITLHVRPVLKVQRRTKAIAIFKKFKQGAVHFALVYSHEKLIGFITLDNLLQAFVGKMQDEFHPTPDEWEELSDGSYLIKGSAPLHVIEKLTDTDLSQYKVDTVAGLMLETLGHLPMEGEILKMSTFLLCAQKVSGSRVMEVLLSTDRSLDQ